jgi:D-serine deaminase-like pyridoxal phosphate-dependent protein
VVLAAIPTPALLIDPRALDRNIRRMAEFFAAGSCRLRPHFKAHKTPEIARRQLAAGSCTGLTCATVAEAEQVVEFCHDVLIANEVVRPAGCDRVAAAARLADMTVAVDSREGLERLAVSARRAGVRIGVLVDVDVGQGRCGVAPGRAALDLARRASETSGLRLRGVMGYEGHLQPLRDRRERESRTRQALAALLDTAALITGSGLTCEIVSAGGTGTFDITGRLEGVTEVQAGSYALMDADYAAVGVPFEHALSVVGTVISRPTPTRLVADCGHKSVTRDHGYPVVKGIERASVTALNDEHVVITLPPSPTPSIGDLIEILPSHVDPTINLHDVLYVVDDGRVVDAWPVRARGYAEQRATLAP